MKKKNEVKRPRTIKKKIPTIVVLCGSTKFENEFTNLNKDFSMAGKIVLSCAVMKSDLALMDGEGVLADEIDDIKDRLDTLHLRKIDLADEVFVVNVDGYIGDSTKREIKYAMDRGKKIDWLRPPTEGDGLEVNEVPEMSHEGASG